MRVRSEAADRRGVLWAGFAAAVVSALVAVQALSVVPATATAGNVEVEVQGGGAFASDGQIASDGTDRLVVWTVRTSDGRAVKAALVHADGTIGPVQTVSVNGYNANPRVAWNGSTYLIVWQHEYSSGDIDIFGRKVSKAGAVAPSQFGVAVLSTAQEVEPTLVAGGSTFFVAWSDTRNDSADIWGTRISTSGNGSAVDSPGIHLTTDPKAEVNPRLAWNGSRYYLTYEFLFGGSDVDVHGKTISASIVPSATALVIAGSSGDEHQPVVASNGAGFLVVWADGVVNGDHDIKAQRLDGNGSKVGAVVIVSDLSANQSDPTVAFNGTYLAAWTDEFSDPRVVMGARIDGNGNVLDGNGGVRLAGPYAASFAPVATKFTGDRWALVFGRGSSGGLAVELRTVYPK